MRAGLCIALVAALGCSPKHDTFRAVFITDTHIIGPQYVCCQENSPADNDSIVKTVDRLTAVRDEINAITPAPAMVFVMGDVVHAAHVSRDPQYYVDNPTAWSIARDLFAGFKMPVYLTMGNHDYEVDCGSANSAETFDPAFSESLFQEFLGQPPYQAVDYHGWKFLLVDSQRGSTFDVTSDECDTDFASLGAEQMTWAEQQLDENKPTVVMSHYMRILYEHDETGDYDSFPDLVDAHSNIKGWFAGHTHRWLDMSSFNNDVPHWVLGGTRYDTNNFSVVEFDATAKTMKLLDIQKGILNNSCANAWTYVGTPAPDPNPPPDTGDCVSGID